MKRYAIMFLLGLLIPFSIMGIQSTLARELETGSFITLKEDFTWNYSNLEPSQTPWVITTTPMQPTQETGIPTIEPSPSVKCELRILDVNHVMRQDHYDSSTIITPIERLNYVVGVSFWYSLENIEWAQVTFNGFAGWIKVTSNVEYDPLGPCMDLPFVYETPIPTAIPTIPYPTPTPVSTCGGKVNVAVLNVRGGASTNFPVVAQYKLGDRVEVLKHEGDWYKLSEFPVMYVFAQYITMDSDAQCNFPISKLNTVIGIRTVPGAVGFEIMYPILEAKGIPYGVSPYSSLSYCVSALQQGGMCVYRPGSPDCPSGTGDPRAVARDFMSHASGAAYILKSSQNVWIEPTNECTQTPMSSNQMIWWRDFYLEYIEQASILNWPPLAIPGFSPGNGDITLFEAWKPVFVSLKAHNGLMSTHSYTFQSQTGLCVYDQWEAARHILQHKYMLQAGYEIPIIITEAARQSGNAPVDLNDMLCFINKVRQEGYIAAVFLWVGGYHPSWPNANLDNYYAEIAERLQ